MQSIEYIRANKDTLTVEDLKYEVEVRRKLLFDMVGTLYPAILTNEIYEINDIIMTKEAN